MTSATPETIVGQVARDAINDRTLVSKSLSKDNRKSFLEGYWKVAVSQNPQIADLKPIFMRLTSPRDGQC